MNRRMTRIVSAAVLSSAAVIGGAAAAHADTFISQGFNQSTGKHEYYHQEGRQTVGFRAFLGETYTTPASCDAQISQQAN